MQVYKDSVMGSPKTGSKGKLAGQLNPLLGCLSYLQSVLKGFQHIPVNTEERTNKGYTMHLPFECAHQGALLVNYKLSNLAYMVG